MTANKYSFSLTVNIYFILGFRSLASYRLWTSRTVAISQCRRSTLASHLRCQWRWSQPNRKACCSTSAEMKWVKWKTLKCFYITFITTACFNFDMLGEWMYYNKLKLNPEKNACSSIASRNGKCWQKSSLLVGGATVQPSIWIRNSSVFFDKQVNLKQRVTNLRRQFFFLLRQLRLIRWAFSPDALHMLLHSFVSDWNLASDCLPGCNIRRLQ